MLNAILLYAECYMLNADANADDEWIQTSKTIDSDSDSDSVQSITLK